MQTMSVCVQWFTIFREVFKILSDTYWKLTEKERHEQDIIDSKEKEPKVRYYFWTYCRSYGWRQMGRIDGYNTIEELKEDCEFYYERKNEEVFKIMKATNFEEVN